MSNNYYANSRPSVSRLTVNRSVLPIPRNAGHSIVLRGLTGSNIDYIQIPGVVPTATCSFGIWFKMSALNGFQRIVSCKTVGGGGFELEENGGANKILFSGASAAGTTVVSLAPTTLFNLGDWVHVGVRCAPNNNGLYINGVLVASDTTHTVGVSSGQILTIGRASFTNGSNFNGSVAGFVLANGAAWNDSQMMALFNGTTPPTPTVLLGFYEYSGSRCYDTSGNNNHGFLTGITTYSGRPADTPASWPPTGRYIAP